MTRILPAAFVSVLMLCLGLGAPAGAVSLGVSVNPALGFALTGAVEMSDDGTNLIVNNASGASLGSIGIPGLTDNAFDLLIFGDSLGVPSPGATLFVDGVDGSVEGELADFVVGASLVELLFDVTNDDFGRFGSQLLVVVTGDFSAGLDAADASVSINAVAPIPLPATLPMLVGALATVVAIRRVRGTAQA